MSAWIRPLSASSWVRYQRRADRAGLIYVNDFDEGITRRRCGRGYTYLTPSGRRLRSIRIRHRIKSLAIPPAWQDVWICPSQRGHIQAVGCDNAGRRQYIYHPQWSVISTAVKFDRMETFATLLPKIRRRVRRDLRRKRLCRDRVTAAVIRMLDRAHLRIGNSKYLQTSGARGATTLTDDHVEVDDIHIQLDFPGKSGQHRQVEFRDARVADVIAECQDLDGQFLFAYPDRRGRPMEIRSSDVNRYLRRVCRSKVTAKDFRTWAGSVIATDQLCDLPPQTTESETRRAIRRAVKTTAGRLGNTPAVCRSSYIHPAILRHAADGRLPELVQSVQDQCETSAAELSRNETLFRALLPKLDPVVSV